MMTAALILTLALQEEWESRAPAEAREVVDRVASLSEDLSLLNLLNGLHLTREQTASVRDLARRAGELRTRAFNDRLDRAREFADALAKLRDCAREGAGTAPPELEQQVQRLEGEVTAVRRDYQNGLRQIQKELDAVLSDGQREVVLRFNPCLIPPRDLKDPVRVGQTSSEHSDIEDGLGFLRGLPDRIYGRIEAPFMTFFLDQQTLHLGPFQPGEREREAERLRAILTKARAMKDEDFSLEKPRLAADAVRRFTDFQSRAGAAVEVLFEAFGGLSKTGKWLLNPRIVPILDERLARPEAAAVRPAKEPGPAEKCDVCGDGAANPVGTIDKKPRFSALSSWLGLSAEQADAARRVIGKAQIGLLDLLTMDRPDGRLILGEVLAAATRGEGGDPFAKLGSETIPGTKVTYLSRLTAIKLDAMRALREVLTPEQNRRLRGSGVDLFEVGVENLRALEE